MSIMRIFKNFTLIEKYPSKENCLDLFVINELSD